MIYTVRPISDRTWLRPNQRRQSQFDTPWMKTVRDLEREIELLDGKNVVIECDVREQDIKMDGMLRANARLASPAVAVAFETKKYGPMLYQCDRYVRGYDGGDSWQHNVRAIALTLEAARSMDRWGATQTGQQYVGFKALPMPAGPVEMSEDEAWSIIGSYQNASITWFRQNHTQEDLQRAFRLARAKNHPDRRGGDQTLWDKVEAAGARLGVLR